MKTASKVGVILAATLSLVFTMPLTASAASDYVIGTPGSASGLGPANVTFTGMPNTATVSLSNADMPFGGGTAPMGANIGFWGGVGDTSTAFTPNTIDGTQSSTWWTGWSNESECSNLPSTMTPGQVYPCSGKQTVTIAFSTPTSNPILNIADLAGGGYTSTIYSDWVLDTPGATLSLLSHSGNFEVHANGTSFGTIEPPGTGFVPGTPLQAVDLMPNATHPTKYGSGYGAVMVQGTFTEVKFTITYNYRNFSATEVTTPSTTNTNNPEGVALLVSIPANQLIAVNQNLTPTRTASGTYTGTLAVSDNSGGVTYSLAAAPSHGTVTVNADGTFAYSPTAGYAGTDTFTYKICDTNVPTNCVTATATLTISSLANTGSNETHFALLGVVALVIGSGLLMGIKVRSRRNSTITL